MTTVAQPPTNNSLQILGVNLSLRSLVNHLENAIIIISGPAIAISGIIAGIDLLTGGSMFKDVAWLSLTWAICLLLTLDFQVLVMGTRAKQIYTNSAKSGKRKFVEILMIIVIAAAISSVSVQMQSIIARTQATISYTDRAGLQHTRNLTIDEATRDMGINPIALIWERSALVLVLIFMSGWFRDEKTHEEGTVTVAAPATQPVTPPTPVSSISEQDMQRILAALSEVAQMKDELRQLRDVQVSEITPPTENSTPAIPEHAESALTHQSEQASDAVNEDSKPLQGVEGEIAQIGAEADEKPLNGVQGYGDMIADLFKANPLITDLEVVEKVGCSRTTAIKWLKRVRPETAK